MTEPQFGFRIVDHPADLALAVEAEILPDIYRFCAMGMTEALVGLDCVRTEISERIIIKGRDLEELLIRMLGELLYLFSTRKVVFKEFIVEYLNYEKLTLFARGEKLDDQRHAIKSEIKAATYHNLLIDTTDHGFTVTVVFDL